jgi:hypothetical protein
LLLDLNDEQSNNGGKTVQLAGAGTMGGSGGGDADTLHMLDAYGEAELRRCGEAVDDGDAPSVISNSISSARLCMDAVALRFMVFAELPSDGEPTNGN